jgi:hypothetical protein
MATAAITVESPRIQRCVLGATVESVAEAFYQLNSHIYMFSNETGWYYLCEGNKWYPTRKINIFKAMHFITDYIKDMCEAVFAAMVVPEEEVDSRFLAAKKRVSSKTFIKNVASALRRYYYREDLAQYMYECHCHLFAFDDCVMNMRTLQVRPIQPEDCIVRTCGYAYREVADDEIEKVRMALEAAVPDTELLHYLLRIVARALGSPAGKPVHILREIDGRGGKRLLLQLARMAFGHYWGNIYYHYLTKKWSVVLRMHVSSLIDVQFCKMVLCDAPIHFMENDSDRNLRGDTLKMVTGSEGNKITCKRAGARFNIKYVPQFQLFLDADHTPKVMGQDNVARLISFPAAAAADPSPLAGMTEQAKGRAFFGLLLRILREERSGTTRGGVEPPQKVIDDTRLLLAP